MINRLLLLYGLLLSCALPLAAAEPIDAQALVRDLLSRRPVDGTEVLGLLKIVADDRPTQEVPVKWSLRVGDTEWQDVYESQRGANRAGELLVIHHRTDGPNEYLGAIVPSSEVPQPRALAGEEIWRPFAGSDFFIGDLGLEFLHWPSHKVVKREMRKGRSCRVIESLNPSATVGPYSRVLSWIDHETGNIIRAEGYDRRNKLLKEFSVRKIARVEGEAHLKEIEIRNDQTDSRTRLEFKLEVP